MAKKYQFLSNYMPNFIKNLQISEGKTACLKVCFNFLDRELRGPPVLPSIDFRMKIAFGMLTNFLSETNESSCFDFTYFAQVKLSCDERFTHAFTACSCVFKVITLVGSNQGNYFENDCRNSALIIGVNTCVTLLTVALPEIWFGGAVWYFFP